MNLSNLLDRLPRNSDIKLSQDNIGGFLKPSTVVLLSIGGLLSGYYYIYLAFLLLAALCVLFKNKRIVISAYLGYLLIVGYFVSCYSSFYEDWIAFFTIALPHVIGLIEILKDEQLYHYSMKIDLLYCIPIVIRLFIETLFIVLVFVKFLHMLYDDSNLGG